MTKRTCAKPNYDRPLRARGLCSTHYNQEHQPDRHRRTRACEYCGSEYTTTRTDGRYCSLRCRDAGPYLARRTMVRHDGRTSPAPPPQAPPIATPGRSTRVWIEGRCAHCEERFTASTHEGAALPRYCSRRCGRRGVDARYNRAHGWKYSKWIEPSVRYQIYTRDGWTCHLCALPVDPALPFNDDRAASLDHIVPRSQGGTHEPSNLRLAHRLCNALRSDRELESAA